MAPTQAPARIELHARWRILRGCAFGVRQRTAHGALAITLPADFRFDAVDAAMDTLIGEAPPALPEGTSAEAALAHRLLHWHTCVQRKVRAPVFGDCFVAQAAPPDGAGSVQFIAAAPCYTAELTLHSLKWTAGTLNALLAQESTPAGARDSFDALVRELQPISLAGLNNFHFLHSAHRLGVPTRPILVDTFSFGHGARRRVLQSTVTDRTPFIGVHIAHSKVRTSQLLRIHGLPVADQELATSEADALEIAGRIGYPVVVKPDDEEQGRGVEADLRNAEGVASAYRIASGFSRAVLVEKHCVGLDYRLNVFRDKVVKILLRRPGGVTGDGTRTIAELVAELQKTHRYVEAWRHSGRWLMSLDEEAQRTLADNGRAQDDVPAPGEYVVLRRKCNISAGGIQSLVPVANAHPDNLDLAIRATRALQLDLSGVDVLLPDIARSWLETGGVIIEINARPQFGVQLAPEAYPQVLSELLGGDGRIPLHLVLCASDAELPTQEAALDLALAKRCNGLSLPGGTWLAGRRVSTGPASGFDAAGALLLDDRVEAACCVMTASDVIASGLPADRFDSIAVRAKPSPPAQEQAVLNAALAMLGARVA